KETIISPGDDPERVKDLQPEKDADLKGKKSPKISLKNPFKKKSQKSVPKPEPSTSKAAPARPRPETPKPDQVPEPKEPVAEKPPEPPSEPETITKPPKLEKIDISQAPEDALDRAVASSRPVSKLRPKPPEEPEKPTLKGPKKHKGEGVTYSYSHNTAELHHLRRVRMGLMLTSLLLAALIALGLYIFGPGIYKSFASNPKQTVADSISALTQVDSISYELNTSADFGLVNARVNEELTATGRRLNAVYTKSITADTVSVDVVGEVAADDPGGAYIRIDSLKFKKGTTDLDIDTSPITNIWFNTEGSLAEQNIVLSLIDPGISSSEMSLYRQLPYASTIADAKVQAIADTYSLSSCKEQQISNIEAAVCDVFVSTTGLAELLNIEETNFSPAHTSFELFTDRDNSQIVELRYKGLKNQNTSLTFTSLNEEKPVSVPTGSRDYQELVELTKAIAVQLEAE
ncbi:MAG: hypothetical protein AAF413_02735, partial [Patescibacteria group bacterium]